MLSPTLWSTWTEIFPASKEELLEAEFLVETWMDKGVLKRTSMELLSLSDSVICQFYSSLSRLCPHEPPFRHQKNSSWLACTDITFFNVRATGVGSEHGNFLQAAKLLLGDRNRGIHLGPFTRYDHGTIYAVVSTKTPSPDVWHPILVQNGVMPSTQVRCFVEAAHLLGKAVGYDLEPHVAQYAYPVLQNPGAFRWIKVYTPDPQWLDYLFTPETVYTPENQERIVHEIRVMMTEFLSQEGIHSFDEEPGDTYLDLERKHASFLRGVHLLIRTGYWPVPSHSWNGYGLPRFRGYHNVHNYAEFSYVSRNGVDTSSEAYHVVTPYHFWHDLPLQNSWNWENRARSGEPNLEGIDAYRSVFLYWRDIMGFDFVRFDSVDHIWDSCDPGNPAIPFSDRPTPAVLRDCILTARSGGRQDIGTLAERMGSEIRAYETLGFDLMLGSSMLENPGLQMWSHDLKISEELEDLNAERNQLFSVCSALDTHDTGNVFFRGKSLIELEGADGLLLRLFIARFFFGGGFHRPVYSVMGLTDLSCGLFKANTSLKNLEWKGDKDFLEYYHATEDVASEWKNFLRKSQRTVLSATPEGAEWFWTNAQQELRCRVAFPDHPSCSFVPLGADWVAKTRLPNHGWHEGSQETLPSHGLTLAWRNLP